jgi:peptidoglycan/LPS O-acetylase OafA/YrhL
LLGSWSEAAFFVPARIGFLLLVAAALPAIHQWSRNSAFDRQIGELSYPLYLGQLLVLGLLAGWPILAESTTARTLAVALVSLALAWVVVRIVDRRIEAWRRRLAERAGAAQIGG